MKPFSLVETKPGHFSLLLHAGSTSVDSRVEELGHEANGYFWEGVAQLLVKTEAPSLEGKFDYDPEEGCLRRSAKTEPRWSSWARSWRRSQTTRRAFGA